MKIAVAGGTGFVGRALTDALLMLNHEVFILTRKASRYAGENLKYLQWLSSGTAPEKELAGVEIFINLAGESLNSGRWTDERKKSLLDSRIIASEEIVRIMNALPVKPKLYISASAVGYYGTSIEKTFTESSPQGPDFLAELVQRWEEKGAMAEKAGIRTVFCRFGIILDKTEGALPKMALPYKLFGGGKVGSGRQWVSWIHLKDAVDGILFAIEQIDLRGPVNYTAPGPVTMEEFGQILGKVLQRPHWVPVPEFALKFLLGEMSTLVLDGQKVVPEKLEKAGFTFRYPSLKPALENIYFR